MDLQFELGDESAPCGHALAYFTAGPEGEVYATYIQTFPIPMNLSQYVPPAFASLMQTEQMDAQTATAIPPVAQPIEGGVDWLRRLAELRRDDLVNAGAIYSTDPVNLIGMTQEAVALYAQLYQGRVEDMASVPAAPATGYADLTEGERLAEMTKLVGRLRDTLGTSDSDDYQGELRQLAATMPSKYRSEELLDWASRPGEIGQQLATLHLQRSYKLLNEDYLAVAEIEREIRELQER